MKPADLNGKAHMAITALSNDLHGRIKTIFLPWTASVIITIDNASSEAPV